VRNDGISRRPIELLLVATMLVVVAVACCDKGPKIPTASFIGTVTINGTPVANVEVASIRSKQFDPPSASPT